MSDSVGRFGAEEEGFLVEGLPERLGEDFLLSTWGGAVHIDAVAMAQPRISLASPARHPPSHATRLMELRDGTRPQVPCQE